MNRPSFFIKAVILAVFCCFILGQVAFPGTLDDFEGDATRPRPEKSKEENTGGSRGGNSKDNDNDPVGNCLGSCLSLGVEALFDGISQSVSSMEMPQERDPGSPVLPYVRFDMSWQDVRSDAEAQSYMIQGGYMYVGASPDIS